MVYSGEIIINYLFDHFSYPFTCFGQLITEPISCQTDVISTDMQRNILCFADY